ncbi:MAG: helix-turn-helix domain-containing protein [Myxococcota bacterium]
MSLIAQSLLELFSTWAARGPRNAAQSLDAGDAEPRSEKTDTSAASHLAFHQLYSGLKAQFSEQSLPLLAVRACQLRHLSFFVKLVDTQATVREGIQAYLQLYNTIVDPKLARLQTDRERGTDTIVVDWWDNPELTDSLEFRCVFGMGISIQTVRALLDEPEVSAQAAYLMCPENDQFIDDYEAFFGGPVTLGAKQNRLVFSSQLFDRELARRESPSMPVLDEMAGEQLERLEHAACRTEHLVDRVRDYVREHLGVSTIDQKTVARDLAMSPRTLHRKLQEEGHSFRSLTVEIRTERARELLAKPDYSIQQVADALGYSQASSFHRAFKQWSGQTPNEVRRELLD